MTWEIAFKILESLYYFSGIALVIVAVVGLQQLSISKKNARISAKREALKYSNEQVHFYLTNIIKLQNYLDEEIKKYNINFYQKADVVINGKSVKVKFNSGKEEVEKLKYISGPFGDMMNAVECFAASFISKLADEKSAFKSVGKTYCLAIREYMPQLIIHTRNGYYKNLMELFFIWDSRIQQIKLIEDKTNIEERLSEIDNKIITPLGTD